jgi:glycosyltransferase involved in cell wall biosynthesis
MIKISIIVPVYNVEKYLHRCLDSLVAQTLDEIEIITIDDASPDQSFSILQQYKESYPDKIKVIRSKENLRQGGAKNLGIRSAKGQFIGFVDSDDWVHPTMFEKLLKKAESTGSDIVDCNYFEAWEVNDIKREVISNYPEQIGNLNFKKKKELILHGGRMVTKIFKKSLFLNNDLFFPKHLFYEDNEIMPLLWMYSQKLAKVDEALYYYFKGGISTTSRKNSYHHFDRLITSVNMKNHFKKRGFYKEYSEEIEGVFIQLYYVNTIAICLNKFDVPEKHYLKQIRDYMKVHNPDYRSNIYFKSKVNLLKKTISFANDLHPQFAILINYLYPQLAILKNNLKRNCKKLLQLKY